MSDISGITINNLTEAIRSLKRKVERANALSYINLKYELEKATLAGKDVSEYSAGLDYIATHDGDMPLCDVLRAMEFVKCKKRR